MSLDSGNDWTVVKPNSDNFTSTLTGLDPATDYEIIAVSVAKFADNETAETESAPIYVHTAGSKSVSIFERKWTIVGVKRVMGSAYLDDNPSIYYNNTRVTIAPSDISINNRAMRE